MFYAGTLGGIGARGNFLLPCRAGEGSRPVEAWSPERLASLRQTTLKIWWRYTDTLRQETNSKNNRHKNASTRTQRLKLRHLNSSTYRQIPESSTRGQRIASAATFAEEDRPKSPRWRSHNTTTHHRACLLVFLWSITTFVKLTELTHSTSFPFILSHTCTICSFLVRKLHLWYSVFQ